MTISLTRKCPGCKNYKRIYLENSASTQCPDCGDAWPNILPDFSFKICPCCQNDSFFIQKDFNQTLGCFFVGVAAILVPWTYGLSLVTLFLIDRVLRPRIKNIVVCYRCRAEFRGFQVPDSLHEFEHHIGIRYDKTLTKDTV